MFFKPYARLLVVAASLAVLAGCSSTGGTQDGSLDSTGTAGGVGTGTVGTGQVGGVGVGGNGTGTGSAGQLAGAQIPQSRTIYFEYDSDIIRPEFESLVNSHADYLSRNPSAHVTLHGHTDERGTREYNLALGERRAGAVKRYLSLRGVSPSQVEVVSYGEERPAVRGGNESAFSQNRRVVFVY